MQVRNDFYVYLHKKLTDGRVFYVGKGTGNRAYSESRRNIYWRRVAKKYGYEVEIYKDSLSESDAFGLEIELIQKYGIENLTNLTIGGEGVSGYRHTYEQKKKRSDFCKKDKKTLNILKNNSNKLQKSVCCSNGMIFSSQRDAERWLKSIGHSKAASTVISKCCNGKAISAYGFQWHYLNERYPRKTKKKPIKIYCSNGLEFENMQECINWMASIGLKNLSTSAIYECIDGKRKSAYGFLFSKNKPPPIGMIKKSKPVVCSNGFVFSGAHSAVNWLKSMGFEKAARTNITRCCKEKLKIAYGFSWKYLYKPQGQLSLEF